MANSEQVIARDSPERRGLTPVARLNGRRDLPVADHFTRGVHVFDVDIRDYRLWMLEEMPVILILFDASHRRAYWLPVQQYFRENSARRPQKGAKTVRVRISNRQTVNRRAVRKMRELKGKF